MKHVLMSGGSSGMGLAIRTLLEQHGYKVTNIGRRNSELTVDLRDNVALEKTLKTWLKSNSVDVLINCAGVGIFEPHEELQPWQIQEVISVNLTAPLIITQLCLRNLKQTQGHVFNITSIEATRHAKFSGLYTATKSGLRGFSLCLFEEVRKSGVKVTSLNPDMTDTPFFDELRFKPSDDKDASLQADNVAQTLLFILENEAVVTDMTIRSPKFGIAKK